MTLHGLLLLTGLGVALQAALFRRYNLRHLTYERYWSRRSCHAGEEVELVERLVNRKPLPVPWLRLESLLHVHLQFRHQANLEISGGEHYQNHRSLFSLLPFTRITRRHRVKALQRGCYRLSSASLTAGDVLGLSRTNLRLELDAELLVYPRLLDTAALELPGQSWQGDLTVRRWIVEDPFLTDGTREYRQGDSPRRVHWGATARAGSLQVHRHEYTAEQRLMIYVNVEDHEKMWSGVNRPDLIEQALSAAASYAALAISRGMETGFGTNAGSMDRPASPLRMDPLGGAPQLDEIFAAMARVILERALPFDAFLEEEAERMHGMPRMDFLLISAYQGSRMQGPIDRLRADGHTVNIFIVPDEKSQHAGSPSGEIPPPGAAFVSPQAVPEGSAGLVFHSAPTAAGETAASTFRKAGAPSTREEERP